MEYPNLAYTKERDPHYKGSFTFCDDRGDMDVSKKLLDQSIGALVGDTAVIFGSNRNVCDCIETGEFIYDGDPDDLSEDPSCGKWVWTVAEWKDGDWANISKNLSEPLAARSVVFGQLGVRFIVDRDDFKLTTEFKEVDPLVGIYEKPRPFGFKSGSLSATEINRRTIQERMFNNIHRQLNIKDESQYRGKYTYYSSHPDLESAKVVVQNFTKPIIGSTAIAFSTNRRAVDFMSIGTYTDDSTGGHWEWDYSDPWNNGDWAEIENKNADWLLYEFTPVEATILFHSRIDTRDIKIGPIHAGMRSQLTLADIRPYIASMLDFHPPKPPYFEYPAIIKPINITEEIVAGAAIMEYRKRLQDTLQQIEEIRCKKFPYGTFVKRRLPGWWKRETIGGDNPEIADDSIGKIIGWDFENKYYRAYFGDDNSYVGCEEDKIELWAGEVPEHIKNYKRSIDSICINLQPTWKLAEPEEK